MALIAAAVLGLSACGASNSSNDRTAQARSWTTRRAPRWCNASDQKGGTLKMGLGGAWGDSFDPGDTYYGYSWNLLRNYARTLVMFKPAPGKQGLELVPDMATDLGKSSDGGKTWTYTIQKGLKFEDGTPITTKDIAYAVSRNVDRAELKQGPSYFADLLNWPAGYKGPFKSPKNADISSAIETPNDSTIVFHLKQPFAEFDYLAQLPTTAPVPAAKDTGKKYTDAPDLLGPVHVEGQRRHRHRRHARAQPQLGRRRPTPTARRSRTRSTSSSACRPTTWTTSSSPVTRTSTSPAPACSRRPCRRCCRARTCQARADNPVAAREWFTQIVGTVKPLDNVDCRKAVIYAMSPTSYQNAYGGKFAGGEIATTVLPPPVPGYKDSDIYGLKSNPNGQVDKAKEELKKCGQPNGFTTTIGYRSSRDKEKKTAEAFQQSLGKVGIKVNIKAMPDDTYTSELCGKPSYLVDNKIGMCVYGWAADWNTGYGYLAQLVDSRTINPEGGSPNFAVRIPEVDKLIDQMAVEPDANKRSDIATQIDQLVMENAFYFPGIYSKAVLLRGKNVTNVFVNDAFGEYDYTAMGKKQ